MSKKTNKTLCPWVGEWFGAYVCVPVCACVLCFVPPPQPPSQGSLLNPSASHLPHPLLRMSQPQLSPSSAWRVNIHKVEFGTSGGPQF